MLLHGKMEGKHYMVFFNHFIHPPDEGYALIVLENNVIRYKEV